MSLKLAKDYAILDTQDENGFEPLGDGWILFHFKNGTSLLVSPGMYEKITATFEFIAKKNIPNRNVSSKGGRRRTKIGG